MSRVRWVQAGLAALVIAGLWIGFSAVQTNRRGDPLLRWVPAATKTSPGPVRSEPGPASAPEMIVPVAPAPTPEPPTVKSLGASLGPAAGRGLPVKRAAKMAPPAPKKKPKPKSYPPLTPAALVWIKDLIQAELDATLGFRPNDLLIGKLADNTASRQAGEMQAIQSYLALLCDTMNQPDRLGALRKNIIDADLEKWWFPSAEKSLTRGVRALEAMFTDLETGNLKLAADPKALKKQLELLADLLQKEQAALTEDGIGFTKKDNRFYHAQGVVVVCGNALDGILGGFAEAVKDTGIEPELKEAINWLSRAVAMDPLLVMGGDLDGLSSNHLVIMAYVLEKARDQIVSAALKIK